MSEAIQEDELKKLELAQVAYLYKNSLPSVPFNILCGLTLIAFFWGSADHTTLIVWFLLILGISLIRIIHARITLASDSIAQSTTRARRLFSMGAFATGIIWSLSYISFGAEAEESYRLLNVLAMAGLASGAFTSMGTNRTSYLLFITPMLTTVAVASFLQGTRVGTVTSFIIFIYFLMMTVTHQLIYNMIIESINLRFKNAELLEDLTSSNSKLEKTNEQLNEAQDYLLQISQTDELTSLANRRGFNIESEKEWRRSRRRDQIVSCLMIDIDHFKDYNDHYGHPQGDECLARVAKALKSEINRPDDIIARYGGEEFVALFPATKLEDGEIIAQRILQAVSNEKIEHLKVESGMVSISIGLAAFKSDDDHTLDDLINAADEALYRAKENGRNQIST